MAEATTTIIKEASDINTSLKLTSMLLNGKNYQPWAIATRITLKGKGKLGFIDGTKPKPTIPTEAEEWELQDNVVMSWILHSMEPNISECFVYRSKSSKVLWENIQKRYGKQNNYAHIFKIKQEIAQNKQNQRPFADLLSEMQNKWDELDILQPDETEPDKILERKEQERVFQLLANLDSSYEQFRSQILMAPVLPSMENVVALIEEEETRRSAMGDHQASHGEGSEAQALNTQNPRGKGAARDEIYANCKKLGHNKDGCWFLHPHLRPAKWVDRGDRKKQEKGGSSMQNWGRNDAGVERGFATCGEVELPAGLHDSNKTEGPNKEAQREKLFQQFEMWYNQRSHNDMSGPGNREDDW